MIQVVFKYCSKKHIYRMSMVFSVEEKRTSLESEVVKKGKLGVVKTMS